MRKDWPDIADLVPHSGVARLLTHVVSCSSTEIHAAGAIPARHPLVIDGEAPPFMAIELGAQAAAAMEAIGRRAGSDGDARPQPGSVVRVREARFECTSFPVETPIHVTAELLGSAHPLAIYRIRATLNGATVVRAVISTRMGPIGGHS